MTGSIHEELELYAAGALSDREMLAFDDHLVRCGLCQSRMSNALEAIARLIPDSDPPPEAWSGIVAAIQA